MSDTIATPAMVAPVRSRARAITAVAACSGFAGLGYEVVWSRLLAVSLGHEFIAVLGVVAGMFAGIALGSLTPGRHISRSAVPGRWYAVLEVVIGAWALALIPLSGFAGDIVAALLPIDAGALHQWLFAFGLPFVLLLPATMAMGGTLPALEAVLAARLPGGAVGRVYAANTAGAVLGTLATTFLIIPQLGLSGTLGLCALINLGCAAALWFQDGEGAAGAGPSAAAGGRAYLAPLFLTGLLGIGYEVLTIRVVSQILENTVYTFSILLAVYLAGTAFGAALHSRLAKARSRNLTRVLVLATALACTAGAVLLSISDEVLAALKVALPATLGGRLAAEFLIAAVVFLPPTIAMGALFTQLAQSASDRAGGIGTALAVNMFGAALAPIIFGPVLLPLIGAKVCFALVAAAYLLVLPDLRRSSLLAGGAVSVAALALAVSPLSLRFVWTPPGGEVVWHRDGVMATVSVIRNAAGEHHLQVNNHFRMGGSASVRSDHREAHIPLLLHPDPKRALFLGLGTGATLSAAGDYPGLVADGVELVPEVVESFPMFTRTAPQLGKNPDISVHVADARRFVRASDKKYDVVVADLYHPSVDGSSALYAREHFEAIRAKLAAGGIFCQWLPLHQLDIETLRLITRTFLDVFPESSAYLAQLSVETPLIALIGRAEPQSFEADWLNRRVTSEALRGRLTELGLDDGMSLFGLHLAGAKDLRGFVGTGPLNTDDKPFVAAEAPRIAYAARETPGDRLVTLLRMLKPKAEDVLAAGKEDQDRLAAYWQARDLYLEMGVQTLAAPAQPDLMSVLAPRLFELVAISPEFSPAYQPLITIARRLAATDPAAARRLLEMLDRVSPARSEARSLLLTLPRG
jgi:spermidine synthase